MTCPSFFRSRLISLGLDVSICLGCILSTKKGHSCYRVCSSPSLELPPPRWPSPDDVSGTFQAPKKHTHIAIKSTSAHSKTSLPLHRLFIPNIIRNSESASLRLTTPYNTIFWNTSIFISTPVTHPWQLSILQLQDECVHLSFNIPHVDFAIKILIKEREAMWGHHFKK